MTIYYVYAYLRKSDNTPYYIGKGKGNRAFAKHNRVPVPKDKSRIVFLKENLNETDAFAHECEQIRLHGRKDLNTGILLNRTDGGDGASGLIFSEETRKRLSEANTGRKESSEEIERKRQRQLGQKHSPERNAKRSAALKGRKLSPEHIAKRSATVTGRKQSAELIEKRVSQLRGRTPKQIECPHCGKVGSVQIMPRWHFDRCKHK